MSEALIVVGNGMAAARFVEELARRALGRYAVAVIGEEPRLAYNRVLLSALLAEEVAFSDIELKPARWWRDRGVTLRYGVRATAVDARAQGDLGERH
jgi:nitrite reductase (NADH) large subunit